VLILEFVAFNINVEPASASSDTYTDKPFAYVTFTVEGATFVKKTVAETHPDSGDYWFSAPSQGQIKVTAQTETTSDYGSGQAVLWDYFNNAATAQPLDDDNASAGLPMYLSGSVSIDHILTNVDLNVDFEVSHTYCYIHLFFFAKPTISTLEVNATTAFGNDAVRVYGQVAPKDYAGDVNINYTQAGQTGMIIHAESGISSGSFADTFAVRDHPGRKWTATAQVNASYESFSSYSIYTEFPQDLLTDSISVSFTTTGAGTPSNVTSELLWKIAKAMGEVGMLPVDELTWKYDKQAIINAILEPGDSVKTGFSLKDVVKLTNNAGTSAYATKGAQLTVPESGEALSEFIGALTMDGQGSTYFDTESDSGARLRVVTSSAIITDSGTQFEVLVDDTGTWVRTFSGSVKVTDINNTYAVDVGAGQTTSVPNGGYPYSATLFDASTAERWWETLPSSTPAPGGFDFSSFTGTLSLLIVIVAVVVVVVVMVVVVWSRRRKPTGQVFYPPPPPPSNTTMHCT